MTLSVGQCVACALLLTLAASCSAPGTASPPTMFRLDRAELSPEQAAPLLLDRLADELDAHPDPLAGYPAVGSVILLPDPDNPSGTLSECAADAGGESSNRDCIRLNGAGDFLQVTPISYQSAAFHMIRIFVQPGSREVDLTRDYVAVDIFLMHEPDQWGAVMTAIANAAQGLGAQTYRP